jgi:hypothetical protein
MMWTLPTNRDKWELMEQAKKAKKKFKEGKKGGEEGGGKDGILSKLPRRTL